MVEDVKIILIVDDEEGLRELAEETLTSQGYRVELAASGVEAMALMDTLERIDLLFSDIVMPGGVSGYQLAEHALAKFPNMQILLTSGYTANASRNVDGRQDVVLLDKPYSQKSLVDKVNSLLTPRA